MKAADALVAAWDGLDARIRAVQPAELREAVEGLRAALDDAWDPGQWVACQTWTFAASVPQSPHEYLVPDRSTDRAGHMRMVALIRSTGEPGTFAGHRYRYLTIAAHTYWIGPGVLLNRRAAER